MPLTITPPWEHPYWYESSVQLALKDLCRSQDAVFDIGANIGGISTMVARHVGPTGRVVAFEASPRTFGELHTNLSLTHSVNVQVVCAAVAEQDGGWMPFFFGGAPVADSLIGTEGQQPSAFVPTISLDAFCERTGLRPDVVKMDIEGGEFAALKGFEKTLSQKFPPLILEMSNRAVELHEWLLLKGYAGVDLATYTRFAAYTEADGRLCNVLYVHPRGERGLNYLDVEVEAVAEVGIDNLTGDETSGLSLPLGSLPQGRYLCSIDFSAESRQSSTEIELAIGIPGQLLALHISPLRHIAKSYSCNPIHLERASPAYILAKRMPIQALREHIRKVRVSRVLL